MAHLMADSWNTGMASNGASSPVHRMSRALTPWQPSRPTTSGLLEIPIKTAILPRSLSTGMEQLRASSLLDSSQDFQLIKAYQTRNHYEVHARRNQRVGALLLFGRQSRTSALSPSLLETAFCSSSL